MAREGGFRLFPATMELGLHELRYSLVGERVGVARTEINSKAYLAESTSQVPQPHPI